MPQDPEKVLADAPLSEEVLAATIEHIRESGWEPTLLIYENRRKEKKRQWAGITGKQWGSSIGASWLPEEGWENRAGGRGRGKPPDRRGGRPRPGAAAHGQPSRQPRARGCGRQGPRHRTAGRQGDAGGSSGGGREAVRQRPVHRGGPQGRQRRAGATEGRIQGGQAEDRDPPLDEVSGVRRRSPAREGPAHRPRRRHRAPEGSRGGRERDGSRDRPRPRAEEGDDHPAGHPAPRPQRPVGVPLEGEPAGRRGRVAGGPRQGCGS